MAPSRLLFSRELSSAKSSVKPKGRRQPLLDTHGLQNSPSRTRLPDKVLEGLQQIEGIAQEGGPGPPGDRADRLKPASLGGRDVWLRSLHVWFLLLSLQVLLPTVTVWVDRNGAVIQTSFI